MGNRIIRLTNSITSWRVLSRAKILLDKTDAVCVHGLSTLLHYVVALDEGADPVKLGLSKDREHAYM